MTKCCSHQCSFKNSHTQISAHYHRSARPCLRPSLGHGCQRQQISLCQAATVAPESVTSVHHTTRACKLNLQNKPGFSLTALLSWLDLIQPAAPRWMQSVTHTTSKLYFVNNASDSSTQVPSFPGLCPPDSSTFLVIFFLILCWHAPLRVCNAIYQTTISRVVNSGATSTD